MIKHVSQKPKKSSKTWAIVPFVAVCFLTTPLVSRGDVKPISLSIDANPVSLKVSALSDGKEVYIPLSALAKFKATYFLTKNEDSAIVHFQNGTTAEIAIARPGRVQMLPVSMVAKSLHMTWSVADGNCDVHIENVSKVVKTDINPSSSQQERREKRIESPVQQNRDVTQSVNIDAPKIVTSIPKKIADWLKADKVVRAFTPQSAKASVPPTTKPTVINTNLVKASNEKVIAPVSDALIDASSKSAVGNDKPVVTQAPISSNISTGYKPPTIALIRDFIVEETDPDHVQIKIKADSTIKASAKVARDPMRLMVEIPNSRVDENHAEWDINDNFVSGLKVTAGSLPNSTRFVLELARSVKFNILPENNGNITVALSTPQVRRNGVAGLVVVIDPGHGGSTGTAPNGCETKVNGQVIYEKNITLAVGLKVREILEDAGIKVILTRDSDVSVPLEARPQMAASSGADLFVSIHVDDFGSSVSGHTTYYHSDDQNSRALASSVIDQLAKNSGLPNKHARSDYSLYPGKGLSVLRNATLPATLLEIGYLGNSYDRSKILSPEYHEIVGKAILAGITDYVSGNYFDGTNGVIIVSGAK